MLKTRLPLLLALAALVLGAGTGSAGSAALDQVEAVVTFQGEGAPSAADVAVLQAAGITTGFTFKTLPIAGVLATPAQLDALEASPLVASVMPNEPLEYDNATSTNLTGVDSVRADARLTKRNGNLPSPATAPPCSSTTAASTAVTSTTASARTSSRTSRQRRTCMRSPSSRP